jgi:hypothetical protein
MGESMRKHSILMSGLLLAGLSGCVGDRLQVNNLNNPDVDRAFATPDGVEGVVAGLGQQLNNPQRVSDGVNTQAKIFAGENFATVNNFGMAPRSLLPRNVLVNGIGNNEQAGNLANFNSFQRVARSANNAIRAVDRLIAANSTLGSPAQNARAKAFAFMILGNAMGYTALAYDSAAALTPTIPSDSVPPLMSAAEVGAIAISMLDSAIAIASSPEATSGTNGFPLPITWLNGNAYSRDQFVRLVRSYRARIRAGLARTPAERAAVNWTAVIADATNGITSDHNVELSATLGWSAGYDAAQMYVLGGWHQMPIWYIGMADTSGNYDAWLAVPRASREAILIRTPDTRWPQGDTRAIQNLESPGQQLTVPAGRYLKNRPPVDDITGSEWGFSMYEHKRWGAVRAAGGNGPYTDMSATEISMLAAEGYLRAGQVAQAIPLINASRVRNGLQPIPAGTTATQPIGTMPNCVPRVPQAPNFTSTACGTVLEAMKYEKRMETAFTGYFVWFTDSRGWGDLPATTPVEWPVPYQEMQARRGVIRNGTNVSPLGTYGFQ